MKGLIELVIQTKVSVNTRAIPRGLTKPFADVIEKAIPIVEDAVKRFIDIQLKEEEEKE